MGMNKQSSFTRVVSTRLVEQYHLLREHEFQILRGQESTLWIALCTGSAPLAVSCALNALSGNDGAWFNGNLFVAGCSSTLAVVGWIFAVRKCREKRLLLEDIERRKKYLLEIESFEPFFPPEDSTERVRLDVRH